MAQSTGRGGRVVGDYQVGRQIGSGSFSVVWHGRHLVHGTEVAIKEIATSRLNKKLQESLMSEIFILKKINHPNIIHLYEIIEKPGKIHLVLEYCKGGDLSMYLQRHGKVLEATAKHFMQQLAAGLQILRDNNVVHRDLKPQNLLLSTNSDSSVLKIADFGFARSLQPRGLAETLCGSPLYMAPEIMHLQKYDAKADLWSVGTILFQLVSGNTPFTGNNQIQLLQNIMKATELHFPPDTNDLSFDCKDLCRKLLRRNPVERLTFEEFFNHPFLLQKQLDESSRSRSSSRILDAFPLSECDPVRNSMDSSQEDCLPFRLDDFNGPDGSPSRLTKESSVKSTYGFSLDSKVDKKPTTSNTSSNMGDSTSRYGSMTPKLQNTGFRLDGQKQEGISKERINSMDPKFRSRVTESLESIDQDYVLVSGPPMDSYSSIGASKQSYGQSSKCGSPPNSSVHMNSSSSGAMAIVGAEPTKSFCIGSIGSHGSAQGTSQGSMDLGDLLEQPSTNFITRIESLQQCASAITTLVKEKIEGRKHLEAFSIQLVILALWKQALHICHTQAASAMEGSPTQQNSKWKRSSATSKKHDSPDMQECVDVDTEGQESLSTKIERAFLLEVGQAEELAKAIDPGSTEMPDAMETIFQSALALGRHGAVDELIGNLENAALFYSKAVRLLVFLLVEASSLILNPPFTLTNSDRYRLRTYIEVLNNREDYSRSQRIAILKCEDQQHKSSPLQKENLSL